MLGIRKRRAMGLTFRGIGKATAALMKSGEITGDEDHSIIAAAVLAKIQGDNPEAFADPGVDWDALIEFIERLLPIILQIIEMFS